jgi:hypothetical protein
VRGRKVEAGAAWLLGRREKWNWSELGASWKSDGEDLPSRTFGNIPDEDPCTNDEYGRPSVWSASMVLESSQTIWREGLQVSEDPLEGLQRRSSTHTRAQEKRYQGT